MDPFVSFIPGKKRRPGNAGLSAKELRDRKRKRLEREQALQNDYLIKQQNGIPSSFQTADRKGNEENSHTDPPCEMSSTPGVGPERERRNQPEDYDGILQNRLKSILLEEQQKFVSSQDYANKLKDQVETFEQEEREVKENRCRLQKQINQLEARRTALTTALEQEKAELRAEENKYAELDSGLVALQETFCQMKSRRETIEKAKQTNRAELMQLEKNVEDIKEEVTKSETIQNDLVKEVEYRKKQLESQRSAFASAIKKANSNIFRLRETIETLKEYNRKEAMEHASTLSVANQTFNTGKVKADKLLSENSCKRPTMPTPELKTVFWSPNPNGKQKIKMNARPISGTIRQDKGENESELRAGGLQATIGSESPIAMESYSTPVPRSHSRRAFVDLKSQGDSLSNLGDSRSVDSRKSPSAEKRRDSGKQRKQPIKEAWKTDSLAGCLFEKELTESSPQSFTYMGHEILRRHRRSSPSERSKYY